MKRLAIRGHKTRGKEVIAFLEMLGGCNACHHDGSLETAYSIDCDGFIHIIYKRRCDAYQYFTLEEIEYMYPYKIGDRVIFRDMLFDVICMRWVSRYGCFTYSIKNKETCFEDCLVYGLQPYMEKGKIEDWTFSDAEKEAIKYKLKSEESMKDFILNAGKLGGKGLLDQVECSYSDFNVAAYEAYSNAIKRNKTEDSPNHEKDVLSILEELSEFAKASEEKPSEHLPEYTEAAEELADIIIGCMTELYKRNVDVGSIIRDKMNFNETRQS